MAVKTWADLARKAIISCAQKKLGTEYKDRLKREIKEITKQGANNYWVRLYNTGQKFEHNKNGLVFPYLLDMTPVDPVESEIAHITRLDPEFPDIDIDLLPISRDPIKAFAEKKYGTEHVCNVGLWLTYKARLAIQDSATVLGHNRHEAIAALKDLPAEFDDMSFNDAYDEFESFKKYSDDYPEVVHLAYRMKGKIKSQGKHAGGLIISSVPIRDFVPLTFIGAKGNKQWTSAWTEGMAASQLSKFGLVKFDLLGLLNLAYIYDAKKLIEKSKGIKIDFDEINPLKDLAGWMTHSDGKVEKILLNDPKALKRANDVKLESIFQFDTDLQKSILEKGGTKSFMDLVIYNSLGRPGPLPMVDVYISNRDKDNSWKKRLHPKMFDILEETKGVLTFQEQLLRIWVEVCGFTMPEAEAAQKAVKKKRMEILDEIGPRVIEGATILLGKDVAEELWSNMVSFGRYCFNKSHAVGYTLIAYRCLWLKTHFPAEWWAAVLSKCPNHKTLQFMGAARAEGIKFGSINVNHPTAEFSVEDDRVIPGILSVKGIGKKFGKKLVDEAKNGKFNNFDEFVERVGKDKTAIERLIKLGGFDSFYTNRKALWMWYYYKYCSGSDVTKTKRLINFCYTWPSDMIHDERRRQAKEYMLAYPKRKKIPQKITKWEPSARIDIPRPFNSEMQLAKEQIRLANRLDLDIDNVIALFPKDFTLSEILDFEKEYLGYYWHSPVDVFEHEDGCKIEDAKKTGILECVIEDVQKRKGTRGEYLILSVTDGINYARINVWTDEMNFNDEEVFESGVGARMNVRWQERWRSFSLKRRSFIVPLMLKED